GKPGDFGSVEIDRLLMVEPETLPPRLGSEAELGAEALALGIAAEQGLRQHEHVGPRADDILLEREELLQGCRRALGRRSDLQRGQSVRHFPKILPAARQLA